MANCRLVVLDLDGTLLTSDGTISEPTRNALNEWQASGRHAFVATARPPRSVRLLRCISAIESVVCANGAIELDNRTGQLSIIGCIQAEIAKQIMIDIRSQLGQAVFALEFPEGVVRDTGYVQMNPALDCEEIVGDAIRLVRRPCTKLMVRDHTIRFEELLFVSNSVASEFASITHSTNEFVEISAPHVSKATTLDYLCKKKGISPKEVVAFGDMPNDTPMLRWAGISVAMGNAHEDLKRDCQRIALTNDEDGVAMILNEILSSDVDN